jgi:carboxyl-terminal processing protease
MRHPFLRDLAIGVAIGGLLAVAAPRLEAPAVAAPSGPQGLFARVFEKVQALYVDEPDPEKMTRSAIAWMLASLDPHSTYLDPKSFQDFQQSMKGEKFGGLGIEIVQENNLVRVVSPIDDTPAARIGVQAGDLIFQIDDTPVKDLTLKQAVDKMRGDPQTSVTLKMYRGPDRKVVVYTIVREVIHVVPVRAHVEAGDIGYIRITQFGDETFDGVKKALAKFDADVGKDKLKGYIIDLRNDPGGLLSQAIEVVNAFVDGGVIVSTRGRLEDSQQVYGARPGLNLSKGKPVVVLINGGSASASEIVSGALQDLHRATLIGTRSFGKGSVQTVLPLGENGAIKLTTARYYTPSGRSIQAKGILPDENIVENEPDDLKGKDADFGEASLRGHLKNGDDEAKGSQAYVAPDPSKDNQLTTAIDLLHGVKHAATQPGAAPAQPN